MDDSEKIQRLKELMEEYNSVTFVGGERGLNSEERADWRHSVLKKMRDILQPDDARIICGGKIPHNSQHSCDF